MWNFSCSSSWLRSSQLHWVVTLHYSFCRLILHLSFTPARFDLLTFTRENAQITSLMNLVNNSMSVSGMRGGDAGCGQLQQFQWLWWKVSNTRWPRDSQGYQYFFFVSAQLFFVSAQIPILSSIVRLYNTLSRLLPSLAKRVGCNVSHSIF